MKLALIPVVLVMSLGLAACNPEQVNLIRTQYTVVDIPQQYFDACPQLAKLPKYSKLTDVQVAMLINQLYTNNQKCRNAMDAIKIYLEESKKKINTPTK